MNYSPRVLAGRTFRTADFVKFLAVRILYKREQSKMQSCNWFMP